jgi:hypothetical protein
VQHLGIVDFISADGTFGRVEPLCEVAAKPWRAVAQDEFPPNGRVFWLRPPREIMSGALVFFSADVNTGPNAKDRYRITTWQPATELIDLRKLGSGEQLREVRPGIRLPHAPASKVLLWAKDVVIGPVRLVSADGCWAVEATARPQLPVFEADALPIQTFSTRDGARYVLETLNPPPASEYVDWGDDQEVVRRALSFAATVVKRGSGHVELTRAVINEAAAATTTDGAQPQLRLQAYRLTRARRYIERAAPLDSLAQELLAVVEKHPDAKRLAEAAQAEARKTAQAQLAAEVAAAKAQADARAAEELAVARRRVEDLERRATELTAKVEDKRNELTRAQVDADSQLEVLNAAIATRVAEAVQRPIEMLASVPLLRAVLGAAQPQTSTSTVTLPRPRRIETWPAPAAVFTTAAEIRAAVGIALRAAGVAPAVGLRLHAALAARTLPILAGPRALDVAEAYARAVAGGRSTCVHVTPGLQDPAGVFGQVHDGWFVPQAAGLIDTLTAAKGSVGVALAVLGACRSNRQPVTRSP